MRRFLLLVPLLILLAVALMPIHAQQDTTATASPECVALVEQAMSSLAENCAGLGSSAACVGFSSVSATFSADEVPFSAAGDNAGLDALQSVSAAALDLEAELWGLATINAFANVPLALSPTGIHYVLLGDTTVTNAVDPASAFVPVEPISVVVLVGANLRVSPSTDSTVLASASVGQELLADALSSDGSFVRVVFDGQVAWISSQVVTPSEGDLSSLPTLTTSSRSLMQSITVETHAGSTCANAPSVLLIQGPSNFASLININGADIRFDGTIGVHITDDNIMHLYALNGNAYTGGVSIPPGFTADVQLNSDGTGLDGLWSHLRPTNENERASLTATNVVPEAVLLNPIVFPSQEEVLNTLAAINGAASVGAATSNGTLNCARFRPTSPLGGMPNGNAAFFWDGVQGATSYRINLYNDAGARVSSLETSSTNTTLSVNTTAAAIGG
ncbi:MAG: SH3 domain-containing protein, partial [Anaerolineae bacterium]